MGKVDLFHYSPEEELAVYKTYGRTPETFAQDVRAVKDWLKSQKHLPEVPPDSLIGSFLRGNKCSVERVKERLDMYYTLRSIAPDVFQNPLSLEAQAQTKYFVCVPLPKLTKDLYRITVFLFKKECPEDYDPALVISYITNGVHETRLLEDVALGNIFIIDYSHVTLGHLTKLTPAFLKKVNTLLEKVYNDRQKAAHIIYPGAGADIVVGIMKSLMRAKVRERVFLHKTYATLLDHFPKDVLPKDFGGEGKSLCELFELTQQKLQEHKSRFEKLSKLRTNESLRPGRPVNDDFFGFHGNFKQLQVD